VREKMMFKVKRKAIVVLMCTLGHPGAVEVYLYPFIMLELDRINP
jgi:hypothetical protein